jgi:HD-like signal output (HDOD) protein
MNPSIVQRIKSLPPLPKTLVDIQTICDKPDGTVGELAKVVEHDPMIVANLLKSANSPLYGFGKEIASVSQAVSLFGMSMTRSVALSASVKKLLKVDMAPYKITPDQFAEVSSLQAGLIMRWFKKIDPEKKDKMFLAALMQETGKIIIADEVIQGDEAAMFESEIEATHNIAQVEYSFVEETTATVTAAIFKYWGFDDELVNLIFYSDQPQKAPEDIKKLSMALHIVKSAIPVNAPLNETSIAIALKKASDAGFDHEVLEDEIDAILEAR